jgi:hypothetical protein
MTLEKNFVETMTAEEFANKFEEFQKAAEADLKAIQTLEEGSNYEPKTEGVNFWNKKNYTSDPIADDYGIEPEEVIKATQEFLVDVEEYKNKRGFNISQQVEYNYSTYDDGCEVENVYFEATWYEPINELDENSVNRAFLDYVSLWLAPEGTDSWGTVRPDCKILQLFKEGKVDWNTLRTLTYSNCNI